MKTNRLHLSIIFSPEMRLLETILETIHSNRFEYMQPEANRKGTNRHID